MNRRKDLAAAERPMAMVLSCADSRVPPEHVFSVGLGDLLVIRAAGQVVDRSVLASIEYGASRLRLPLLVVMGHESCDVVRAAAEARGAGDTPNLDYLYKAIHAAKKQAPADRDAVKGWCSTTWSRWSTTRWPRARWSDAWWTAANCKSWARTTSW